MKGNHHTLQDMLEAIQHIEQHIPKGRDQFLSELTPQEAVLWNFTRLGEAVKRLTFDFREKAPEIPWKKIAGLRDVLIHRYDEIDLFELADIIENHLPGVKMEIIDLLSRPDIE